MTTVADFWSQPEPDVKRGSGGSPMLVPEAFEDHENPMRVEYTRASYMADFIESKTHIHKWEMRYLARGLGQNEDLAALAAVETYSTGLETEFFNTDQTRAKTASGRRLDDIVKRTFDRVKLHEKADRGTAVHGLTEPGAPAGSFIPERLALPVEAFWEVNRKECIEIVGTEMFTANDETMSAGTFDHLVRVHGHPDLTDLVVSDKKTGNFDPLSWCIQIATYAYGKVYNTETNRRVAWPDQVNLDHALVWQIDCKDYAKAKAPEPKSRVKLWVVNIALGWELAQLAARVRDKTLDPKAIAAEHRSPSFEKRLELCNTREALTALWYSLEDGDPRRDLITEKAGSL